MTQPGPEDDLDGRIGYLVKRAQAALNAAMDRRLRDLGLGVSQYACLAQVARRPGISNAELARAVFVSRQATHQLLAGMTRAGLVEVVGEGRAQRLRLSASGAALLDRASVLVAGVETEMLHGLTTDERAALATQLDRCADALEQASSEPSSVTSEARVTPGQVT